MSQFDMFSQQSNTFASLDDVIDALKRMKDDPLADAGTNVVISRGTPHATRLLSGAAPGPSFPSRFHSAAPRWRIARFIAA